MNNRVPEVFLSEMFGELRIMKDDNKFYFCAADVCSALGYSNPSHELNIHCRHDGIKAGRTDVNGVPRIIKFISEGNVYRLICRSNKPEAEKFETWVFDELLPRIRQTGGYVNDPVVFVDNWLPNTDAKTKALLVTSLEAVKNQDNIIGVQQESVEFHRAVSASVNSVDFGEFAKCLANDHINIGRNRLMAWLRKEKYIDSANVAYQRYIEQGIFEVKETVLLCWHHLPYFSKDPDYSQGPGVFGQKSIQRIQRLILLDRACGMNKISLVRWIPANP